MLCCLLWLGFVIIIHPPLNMMPTLEIVKFELCQHVPKSVTGDEASIGFQSAVYNQWWSLSAELRRVLRLLISKILGAEVIVQIKQ